MTDSSVSFGYLLQGRWLVIARAVWVILCLVTILIFITAVRGTYMHHGDPQQCAKGSLQEQADCLANDQTLHQFGLSIEFYGILSGLGMVIEALPLILVGILIFSRKSHEPFGLLFSLMVVILGTGLDYAIFYWYSQTVSNYPVLVAVGKLMGFLGSALLVLWYAFPDGHFVPHWTRWLAILWVALNFFNFFSILLFNSNAWPDTFNRGINSLFAASIAFSLIYRYQHPSSATQRQQIKWVVAGATFVILIGIIDPEPYTNPGLSEVLRNLVWLPIFYLSHALLGVSIAFSILRYRLWDIDFIINRSLVYSALTGLLALVFGTILFLASLFIQGQTFVIAFGITALVAGILFNPARRRIQRFVDQRFYHIYIDYQKTSLPTPSLGGMSQVLRQTHFGAYKNLELIGRGGMAEVYKSTHPTLNTPVAIKILPAPFAAQADFRQRFTREAQIVVKLEHPNIVRVFDYGEQDGTHYMVMEYVSGQDLDAFIQAHGKLSLAPTLPLLRQIGGALDYAHMRGLVHRDIKPSNILLDTTSQTRVVLTDFGIAKILDGRTAMTGTGGVLGTFDYIAPEQIEASTKVDCRADVYAFGVMVYQMLTGELPFKHKNPGALLIAHMTQPPPDPRQIAPDLSRDVAHAIQRAMAKDPMERLRWSESLCQPSPETAKAVITNLFSPNEPSALCSL
jgi:predicted Ser/Thr protein kinase